MRWELAAMALWVLACDPPPVAAPTTTPTPKPTASAPAPSEPVPVVRWNGTAVRFAERAEASAMLSTLDGFVAALGVFDRKARMSTTADVDRDAFLAYAGAQARGWPAANWEHWQKAMHEVGVALEGLSVPMPKTILFTSTTGKEEFGMPYTRGNAIIIPESVIQSAREPFGLIAHELFHVVTRHAPHLRDELYAVAGFRRVGSVVHPPSHAERRLTNPDAYANDHAILVSNGERSFLAVPLIRSKLPLEEAMGQRLLQALEIYLLEVDEEVAPVIDDGGAAVVHSVLATDYNAKAALNTDYAIHPEEVLADNFALMLKRRAKHPIDVARPDVLDAVQTVFHK